MFVLGPVFLIILVGLFGLSSVVPNDFETMAWSGPFVWFCSALAAFIGFWGVRID